MTLDFPVFCKSYARAR